MNPLYSLCQRNMVLIIQSQIYSPKSEHTLELHSRAVPCLEAHRRVNGPNAGRNSGARQIKEKKTFILHSLFYLEATRLLFMDTRTQKKHSSILPLSHTFSCLVDTNFSSVRTLNKRQSSFLSQIKQDWLPPVSRTLLATVWLTLIDLFE